jgi:hypothetical protein
MDGNVIAKEDIRNEHMEMYIQSTEDCKILLYITVLTGTLWVQHKWLVQIFACAWKCLDIQHYTFLCSSRQHLLLFTADSFHDFEKVLNLYKKSLVLLLINTCRKQSNMFILNLAKSLHNHFSIMSFNSAMQFTVLLLYWESPILISNLRWSILTFYKTFLYSLKAHTGTAL